MTYPRPMVDGAHNHVRIYSRHMEKFGNQEFCTKPVVINVNTNL
jgi:hypothetical protein